MPTNNRLVQTIAAVLLLIMVMPYTVSTFDEPNPDTPVTRRDIDAAFTQNFGSQWKGPVERLDVWIAEKDESGNSPVLSMGDFAVLLFDVLKLAPDCVGDCPGFSDLTKWSPIIQGGP